MTENLKKSPLHERHVALGAKMADFGGWEMPIEYPGGGVLREHTSVRERVGIFDVSHLGKVLVKGPGAADFVNTCFTNDLRKVTPPKAQYTMCCDDATGGVVDDLIQYFRSDDEVFLIPNCANSAEVVRRMREALPEGIELTNLHDDYGIIAVQGPKSDEVLQAMGLPFGHEYMSFDLAQWQGHEVQVCRTGYTGERGYELVCDWDVTTQLWDALVEAIAPYEGLPCGLGSRDTLRTEMGYPLHGHELSMEITPNMARSGWAIGWTKEKFWGKDALEAQKAAKDYRLTWGLKVTGKGIPRKDCLVKNTEGAEVGVVTSGTMSPTLKEGIALALLDSGFKEGTEVIIDVRGRELPAVVIKPPFVQTQVEES